ncbi:MAG: LLM class flavin-dependent oxidoreductase [Burkholderiales bacterium]
MEFGLFQNGFRPTTNPALTYDEDLAEIVLADQLGFRDVWISEHHGEPIYINKVDTLPIPELLMCRAASVTKNIRMGAAVKLLHLQHPLDIALQAAITDHMLHGRYMFGIGSGFPNAMFSNERGLSFDDRYERMKESLEFILKCWTENKQFNWEGKFWPAKDIVATPLPYNKPHMPIAVASTTEATIAMAGSRGYISLSAYLETAASIKKRGDVYSAAAKAAGHKDPLKNLTVARLIYLSDSEKEAADDLRDQINYEMTFQKARGLMRLVKDVLPPTVGEISFDDFHNAGMYYLGDPDSVAKRLVKFYEDAGGFGTLLMVTGKEWATREKRHRSMKLFMEHVAPKLRGLQPTRDAG